MSPDEVKFRKAWIEKEHENIMCCCDVSKYIWNMVEANAATMSFAEIKERLREDFDYPEIL